MRLLIIFLLLAFMCQCTSLSRERVQGEDGIPVAFTYLDKKAKKICIVGSFNEWSRQSHCMTKDKDIWRLHLSLSPGRYQYLFLIDDQIWKLDPGGTLTEDSGFGTKNSILIVE